MDLTYTDEGLNDVALLAFDSADFAFGVDENDFEVTLADASGIPPVGALVYEEGGEVGGMVRGYSSSVSDDALKVTGDTWTGIFDRRVLRPDSGAMYWSVSGTLAQCLESLISRLGLGDLFAVSDATADVSITHTFTGERSGSNDEYGRYMTGWDAMWQMLEDNGCKVSFRFDVTRRVCVVTGSLRTDWTDSEAIAAGVAKVGTTSSMPVNHLVCLGSGEGTERTVIDLYADAEGNVSTTQSLAGLAEIADVYDDSGAQDSDELTADGTAKLQALYEAAQEVEVAASAYEFDLGDLVAGRDGRTGETATATITKVIVKIDGAAKSVSYESSVTATG